MQPAPAAEAILACRPWLPAPPQRPAHRPNIAIGAAGAALGRVCTTSVLYLQQHVQQQQRCWLQAFEDGAGAGGAAIVKLLRPLLQSIRER